MKNVYEETRTALEELLEAAHLEKDDILVVGCSTSEVNGARIGKGSDPDVAKEIWRAVTEITDEKEIRVAVQCCEHLNRSLVTEKSTAKKYGFEIVNAIPQLHAGGAFAVTAYNSFDEPCLVETIRAKAKAGMDIGQTLIGMHLHPVVVPVRTSVGRIGEAVLTCARTRAKFVGGERAVYSDKLR